MESQKERGPEQVFTIHRKFLVGSPACVLPLGLAGPVGYAIMSSLKGIGAVEKLALQ